MITAAGAGGTENRRMDRSKAGPHGDTRGLPQLRLDFAPSLTILPANSGLRSLAGLFWRVRRALS